MKKCEFCGNGDPKGPDRCVEHAMNVPAVTRTKPEPRTLAVDEVMQRLHRGYGYASMTQESIEDHEDSL